MTTTMTAPTFSVVIQPSQRNFSVNEPEAILEAAIRHHITLPYGCKDGACGCCKTRLVSGSVRHDAHLDAALTAEEKASGLILTCRAHPESDVVLEVKTVVEVDAPAVKKIPVRVQSMHRQSDDVMILQLQLPASEKFHYWAGQYIEFMLPDGSRRAYSMANAPRADGKNDGKIELHIRHMQGGKFTDQVFGSMKERSILRAEGPFGSFFLREKSDKPLIFLASGTGFAPIKALLEQIQQHNIQRPIHLYWGGRRPQDLYLHDWVVAQQAPMPYLTYIPVVSDATPEDAWAGRTGFVHRAVMDDFADLSAYQVYACGAPVVIESAKQDFTTACKLPIEEFFADSFTSEADKAR